MALISLKQWDTNKNKLIAKHFLFEIYCIYSGRKV